MGRKDFNWFLSEIPSLIFKERKAFFIKGQFYHWVSQLPRETSTSDSWSLPHPTLNSVICRSDAHWVWRVSVVSPLHLLLPAAAWHSAERLLPKSLASLHHVPPLLAMYSHAPGSEQKDLRVTIESSSSSIHITALATQCPTPSLPLQPVSLLVTLWMKWYHLLPDCASQRPGRWPDAHCSPSLHCIGLSPWIALKYSSLLHFNLTPLTMSPWSGPMWHSSFGASLSHSLHSGYCTGPCAWTV